MIDHEAVRDVTAIPCPVPVPWNPTSVVCPAVSAPS
jgi:hypothetical protein